MFIKNVSLIYTLVFLFIINLLCSQEKKQWDFAKPLDIPLQLSGTFGELRTNHFHSGVDFRTQQKIGLPIYSLDDGFVSRIKISFFGYGKVIYIDHPNGYTTVYAHLDSFYGDIHDYVEKIQYKEKSFEIEFFLKPHELKVKKGAQIGYGGNTGSSGGPHLHFEIRETASENPLNPMLFGFDQLVVDNIPPTINSLRVYPLSDESHVNGLNIPSNVSVFQKKDGSFFTKPIKASGFIGFAVNSIDKSNSSFGKNGVYQIKTSMNGIEHGIFQFDELSFDNTRSINHYIDYEYFKNTQQKFQKLFNVDDIELTIIKSLKKKGVLDIVPNLTYQYKIEVSDFHGNKSVVNVPIVFEEDFPVILKKPETKYFVKKDKEHFFQVKPFDIHVPENVFFSNQYIDISADSSSISLHNNKVAIANPIKISFSKKDVSWTPQSYLSYNNRFVKTYVSKEKVDAYLKDLGKYVIKTDNTAPKIALSNFKEGAWISQLNSISIAISDSGSGIKTYEAFLNDRWVLFEYEYKTGLISHKFKKEFLNDGINDLKIKVIDHVGNSSIFETHFYKKL